MGLRTTAFDKADALEWDIAELAKRSGLSVETLYKLRSGKRQPGQKVIEGLMRAFPALGYRDLFVPTDSTAVQQLSNALQDTETVAA